MQRGLSDFYTASMMGITRAYVRQRDDLLLVPYMKVSQLDTRLTAQD